MFLGALGAGAAGLAVLFAVLAWLLSTGPISLAFLSPYVEDVLTKAESEFRIEFDDVVLAWAGWERTLDVRALGVRVLRDDDSLLASLPAVSVALSGRALIRGAVALTSLELIGIDARLVRRADGVIDFGLEADPAEAGGLAEQLLDELLRPPDPTRMMGYLRRISILDGKLTVFDQISGVSWRAPRADVVLVRDRAGIEGIAQVDVALGEELVSLTANAVYNSAGRSARVTLRFSDLDPVRLRDAGLDLPRLASLRMPVGGAVELTVDAAGGFSDVALELDAGPGHVDLPELYSEPLAVSALRLRGRFDEGFDSLHIDSFAADFGGPSATLSGRVWLADGARGGRLEGVLDDLTIADLKRLWPKSVAPGAYAWSQNHLHEGVITGAAFRLDAPPGTLTGEQLPEDAFALEFRFDGLSLSYHLKLPPIIHGKGKARLSPKRFDLSLSDGRLSELAVSDATLAITGLDEVHKRARVGAVVRGSIKETMAVLDHEPLGYARELKLDPASLGGLAGTRLQFSFPVKKGLLGSEIRYSAAANLSNAEIPGLYPGYSLSQGTLSLRVDGRGIGLSGLAALNGVPVEVAWQRQFGSEQPFRSRFTVAGLFDDAERAALLLPGGDILAGPVAIELEVLTGDDKGFRATADLELARARLSLPMLHWQKPPEVAGSLQFSLQGDLGGATHVDSFSLAAADLQASGEVRFASGWSLSDLEVSRLVYGGPRGTDVSASYRARGDEGLELVLQGQRFDLRPFLDDLAPGEGAGTAPPLALSARLGELIVSDDRALSDVTATAVRHGGRWSRLQLTGNLSGGAPLQVSLTPRGGRREIKVTSDDAGAVARALDIFVNGDGGTLEARAVIRDDLPGRPIEGQVIVDRFRVRRAPVLAGILTVGSLTGVVDLLNGEGISFARFVAPFTMAEKKVTLEKARAYGPALGVTLDGVIDREAHTVDIEGTIVPAYTINSLLGKIPVLGDIFVGREGGGIFAFTYSAKGPTRDPRVVVNPLAALAPGILRRMLFVGGSDEPLPEPDEREMER
jgi:hypothetical protein